MCSTPEPSPQKFYKKGDRIHSAGYSFSWVAISGPLCRVYYCNGKIEPHALESAWSQINGKWQKPHPNYLSYRVEGGKFITVRWSNSSSKA